MKEGVKVMHLTGAEMQSGYDRLQFAEDLIKQLPESHEGRNTWLLNYGKNGKTISNYEKDDELKEAATPLIKYLNENHHPHVTVIVTSTSVELLEGKMGLPNIYEFIKD